MKSPLPSGDLQKYYQKIYQVQDKILKTLFQEDCFHNFYLTGGTALNRFYYQVRYSEDLDFFNNENHLFREDVRVVMELFEEAGFSLKKENFEKFFLIERLKNFPHQLFDTCVFIKEETKHLYSKILSVLIKDLIKGEENSLMKFKNFLYEDIHHNLF